VSKREARGRPVTVGGVDVAPGRRATLQIPVAHLPTDTWLEMPVVVVNGKRAGPRLWLSAAIHGDELNGVEIVRQIVARVEARQLAGTLLAVPVVNVLGFVNGTRYLPDRRDLNRHFPGARRGSLASRLAGLFMASIVEGSDLGIDLHTGSDQRTNHPQVRADLLDAETLRLARAFGAPFLVHSRRRDGSLRDAAAARGQRVLVFEGGEAGRFNRKTIRAGVEGILRVMQTLGMGQLGAEAARGAPILLESSSWLRARRSGILRLDVRPGDWVPKGAPLGAIGDVVGRRRMVLRSPRDGWVIGLRRSALVQRGDALLHVGAGLPAREGMTVMDREAPVP